MKSLQSVSLYVLLLSLSVPSAVAKSSCLAVGKATVVFDVTDGLGAKLGDGDLTSNIKVESFLKADTGQESRQKFRYTKGMWTAEKVPYGRYTLRVRGSSFASIERPADVCAPFVDLELPTHSATIHLATTLDWAANRPETKFPKQAELVKVISFESGDGTDFASNFDKGQGRNLPYGFYELKAIGPIGGLIHREVDVFQPEVWILGGFDGEIGDVSFAQPNQTVHGKVKHIPDSESPVFVKLMGIQCEAVVDGKVDAATGSFSMAIAAGDCPYQLFILGKSGILDARQISLPGKDEIEIDLDHPHQLFKQ